jgi:hypothetical protein
MKLGAVAVVFISIVVMSAVPAGYAGKTMKRDLNADKTMKRDLNAENNQKHLEKMILKKRMMQSESGTDAFTHSAV